MFEIRGTSSATLDGFVEDFATFIDNLLNGDQSFRIVEALRGTLKEAWNAPRNQARIADLRLKVHDIAGAKRSAHGLEGMELDAKVSVVRYLHNRFLIRGGSALLKRLIA